MDDETEQRLVETAEYVEEAVAVLSTKRELDESSYRDDREQRAIVEREFQTAIEACLDIATLLITVSEEPIPETNAGRFETLERLGILSTETADRMRKAAAFRNILAHTYGDDIDDALVYRHLQYEVEWFVVYLREIREYLEVT